MINYIKNWVRSKAEIKYIEYWQRKMNYKNKSKIENWLIYKLIITLKVCLLDFLKCIYLCFRRINYTIAGYYFDKKLGIETSEIP